MSLYAIGQKVWCKSQNSLGLVTEANYRTFDGKRKAEYVVDLIENAYRVTSNGIIYKHRGIDYLTGSKDLRAADWCCDSCDRYLPGRPYRTAPDGEFPSGLGFCFLCVRGKE